MFWGYACSLVKKWCKPNRARVFGVHFMSQVFGSAQIHDVLTELHDLVVCKDQKSAVVKVTCQLPHVGNIVMFELPYQILTHLLSLAIELVC